jgi:hypothetical protein
LGAERNILPAVYRTEKFYASAQAHPHRINAWNRVRPGCRLSWRGKKAHVRERARGWSPMRPGLVKVIPAGRGHPGRMGVERFCLAKS